MNIQNFGMAIMFLLGIFAIWLIVLLRPVELPAEGQQIVGATIVLATLIGQFYFRKAYDAVKDTEIATLKRKLGKFIKKGGSDIAGE